MRLSPEVCADRRRLWASMRSRAVPAPSPVITGRLRIAAATTRWSITTRRRSSPVTYCSTMMSDDTRRARSTAASTSSGLRRSTETPSPISPRAGFTTTLRYLSRNAARVSGSSAPACSATSERKFEIASLRVDDLDVDAPAAGFLDDDPGIGIQPLVGGGADEERLVDRVLALDGERGNAPEAELFVERDGLIVVMEYREIERRRTATLEVFGEPPDQRLADAGVARLRRHSQAPERRSVLGVIVGAGVIHAHDRAEDPPRRLVFGDEHRDRPRVAMRPEEVGRHRHHAMRLVDRVDVLGVLLGGQPSDEHARLLAMLGAVGGEVEPEGVGGVEEKLLRRLGENHVGVVDVECDVAPVGPFGRERPGKVLRFGEGIAEDEAPPAAVDAGAGRDFAVFRPVDGARLAADALDPVGLPAHLLLARVPRHPSTPCACSQSSRIATCQSSEPRSVVIWSFGAEKSVSR